ncbi:MAG: YjjW family glycine radical enzyme activase [Lachnospiraceae bacterium]
MDISWKEREDKRVPINRIIPFSAVDGLGNRTAIFVQGCNIDCKYCHNPETRAICCNCGACVPTCPTGALLFDEQMQVVFDRTKCVECDTCIRICKHDASPRVTWMSAVEVYEEVRKQVPFIRGVTVSGGECSLYPDFLQELFTLCKKDGLSTLLDSNGMIAYAQLRQVLEVTDGVMLDIKAFGEEAAISVIGEHNHVVLENAKYLAIAGKLEEIRTVVVPELFDARTVIFAIGDLLSRYTDLAKLRYKLITYRKYGVREAYQGLQEPTEDDMKQLEAYARAQGFEGVVII